MELQEIKGKIAEIWEDFERRRRSPDNQKELKQVLTPLGGSAFVELTKDGDFLIHRPKKAED